MIEGSVQIGETILNERDAIGLWDTGKVDINCLTNAQFLLIETPINQK